MKTIARLLIGTLILGATGLLCRPALASSHRPELEYLEAVNRASPPSDPQLLFLLMGEYANANRQREGAEFLEARLAEFGPRLSDVRKSLYLAAIGLLRAGHAQDVSFLKRIGWVKETLGRLDEAKRLSQGQVFVVRWMSGVVSARVPAFFGRRDVALKDLEWCLGQGAGYHDQHERCAVEDTVPSPHAETEKARNERKDKVVKIIWGMSAERL